MRHALIIKRCCHIELVLGRLVTYHPSPWQEIKCGYCGFVYSDEDGTIVDIRGVGVTHRGYPLRWLSPLPPLPPGEQEQHYHETGLIKRRLREKLLRARRQRDQSEA